VDIRLALTGFGNVGRGVASLLRDHGEEYARRYGVRLLLTGVADRGGAAIDTRGLDPGSLLQAKRTHGTVARHASGAAGVSGDYFLEGAQALVLLEAASTNFVDAEPGWSYVRQALAREMDLVLASKGALVLYYGRLMEEARERGRRVLFSGTTGAPVPVLELADRVLVGTRISGFEGILNATCNQILTTMSEGASYDEGVLRAQEMGIAETDPTLDVDGWDAAAKVVIVSNALLGASLTLDEVQREGIRGITRSQLDEARLAGEAWKLIGRGGRLQDSVRAEVRLERRPFADTLGRLRNDEMGIVFHTEPLGQVAATVQQTGGIPTALTVLRDVVNLARDRGWTPIR